MSSKPQRVPRTVQKQSIARQPPASNGNRPAPFRIGGYSWHCSSDNFCIEVRDNLSLRERDEFSDKLDAINQWMEEVWEPTPVAERDPQDTPRRRQMALITPYIRDWNVERYDVATGEQKAVPSPAEAGVEAWELVEFPQGVWAYAKITDGYLGGKGLTLTRYDPAFAPTAETSDGGTSDGPSSRIDPNPPDPASSSAPSATAPAT